jgi:cyclohexanone monooxygenase
MADGSATRATVKGASVDVAVVGAGFGGLYMVHKAREAGLSVQGFEAGGGVGGTWYWNRYPGARCDIPSLFYSFTWSEDLAREWRWSEKYAPQPEILRYAEHIAERFDLDSAFLFNTRVESAIFDEASGRWTVKTNRGDEVSARWVVMATGCLSVPKTPDIPGADSFQGETYLTGLWPHEGVDFAGKRVAVIGTGSSAIQSIPLIAQQAAQVTVYQRTPNFSLPALNSPLGDAEVEGYLEGFTAYRDMLRSGQSIFPAPPPDLRVQGEELETLKAGLWNGMGLMSLFAIPNLMRMPDLNEEVCDHVRDRVRQMVRDPEVAERLVPRGYAIGAKRPCVDTNYYDTFNRDTVSLVDLRETPIETITGTGVRTSAGETPFDVIVFATGFDAMTGALLKMDIRGRGGRTLGEAWAEGPKTYLGLMVAGFPNLFLITGPGSPSVLSNMIVSIEQHVDWVSDALAHLRAQGLSTMETTLKAQEDWVAHVNEVAHRTLYPQANSWYMGANIPGKPQLFMPYVGGVGTYRQLCDEIAAGGYPGFAFTPAEQVRAAE